jgi:hypothetical protein
MDGPAAQAQTRPVDVYWSVQQCGWVPCPARPDPLTTPWSVRPPADRCVDVGHLRSPWGTPVLRRVRARRETSDA